METSSWPLRIALLLIGLAVLGGIWLWAQLRRRRELNRGYERKVRSLRTPPTPRPREASRFEDEDAAAPAWDELPPLPEDDYEIIVKPREQRVEDLPTITREPEAPTGIPHETPPPIAPEEPVGSRAPRRRRGNQLSLGFDEETAASSRPRSEHAERGARRVGQKQAPVAPAPEVLALYLRPLRSPSFLGPALLRAFNAVGLKFGDMQIYHHYGAGELRAEQPLFSLANMFEPGHFDPAAMDDFETAGLAMFIQFPAPLDGPVAFELFLNTAQRLAEALDADLLSDPSKSLDSATIENMRLVAARHSEPPR
ncbi:MAG: cell division protein ZipA C-terminal FtsZ-binding domain-containing protein [Gammaproteobacteria bacterium]